MPQFIQLLEILFIINGGLIKSKNISWPNLQKEVLYALAANHTLNMDGPCVIFARHLHELAGGTTASVMRVGDNGTTIINMVDVYLPDWADLVHYLARLEVARRAKHIQVSGVPTLWQVAQDFVSSKDFMYPMSTDVQWDINDPRIDAIIGTH
jgi:hypothetical protein